MTISSLPFWIAAPLVSYVVITSLIGTVFVFGWLFITTEYYPKGYKTLVDPIVARLFDYDNYKTAKQLARLQAQYNVTKFINNGFFRSDLRPKLDIANGFLTNDLETVFLIEYHKRVNSLLEPIEESRSKEAVREYIDSISKQIE